MTRNQNRTQNPRLSMHMSNTREKSEKSGYAKTSFFTKNQACKISQQSLQSTAIVWNSSNPYEFQ